MLPTAKIVSPPSDDKRWKIVDGMMRRHGHEPYALIEVLHTVQETFGFLNDDSLKYVASSLRVPFSKVYGVATFYHFFTMKPPGEHTCVVCTGTACYIKGAPMLLSAVEEAAGIKLGETTPDGKLGVQIARCIVSCGLAPVVVNDGENLGHVKPGDIVSKIKQKMGAPS
jgi:bidirectional [NiFe] hydrogenase diaphorase subunit